MCYSATENGKLQQAVLNMHKAPSRPRHLFPDVLCRVSAEVHETLMAIQLRHLQQGEFLQMEQEDGSMSKLELKDEKVRVGGHFCRELSAVLTTCEFNSHADCLITKRSVPISPRHDDAYPLLKHRFWIEMSGTACCPFSSMQSNHDGWLSESTVPCLCWAFSNRYYSPSMIVHECVPGFTPETLLASFNLDAHEPIPRCPWASSLHPCVEPWGMKSYVWQPDLFGIPTSGGRRYTLLGGDGVDLIEVDPCEVWGCEVEADLDVYLNIRDPDEDRAWTERHRCNDNGSGSRGTSHLLTSGNFGRYEGHAIKVTDAGLTVLDDGVLSTTRRTVINLKHTASFDSSVSTDHFPSLLRGAIHWDFSEDMIVQSMHKWLVQGFPHPFDFLGPPPTLTNFFPFPESVVSFRNQQFAKATGNRRRRIEVEKTMTEAQVSYLLGNSMHYALISFAFLLAAVTSDKTRHRVRDAGHRGLDRCWR